VGRRAFNIIDPVTRPVSNRVPQSTPVRPGEPPDQRSVLNVARQAEPIKTEDTDSLIAIAAEMVPKPQPKIQRPAKSLPVRQGDKWSDLTATLNAG
jgi:hypothetical protein